MAAPYESASACWSRLSGIKQPLITRAEQYAALTIPKICLPDGHQPESEDQTHDYQSIGAQGTNHLVNKLMLALFAPSRPFFRLQAGKDTLAELAQANITEIELAEILAQNEQAAVRELDALAQRPKLYQAMRHILVTGQVLLFMDKDSIRVMGLRYWCVKRTISGKVHTLVIKECLPFDELDRKVRESLPSRYHSEDKVDFYKVLRRDENGDLRLEQWVNEDRLPKEFDGKWPEDECPYRIVPWDLADESDYATGLVEEYAGDLEALSILSEAVVDGAVQACEVRWLVNPTGQTTAVDFALSKNGDAIPGMPGDVEPKTADASQAIQVADAISQRYEQRVSRGFLINSGVTRQAERVTAEEIRLQAQELETAFGGVYSQLAVSLQKPVAEWLLARVGATLKGTDLKVVVITGLDALSRNSDLEALRLAFSDLGGFLSMPPELQARFDFNRLVAAIGQGRGIPLHQYLKSEEQFQQEQQAEQQARVDESTATAAGEAAAQGAMNV